MNSIENSHASVTLLQKSIFKEDFKIFPEKINCKTIFGFPNLLDVYKEKFFVSEKFIEARIYHELNKASHVV